MNHLFEEMGDRIRARYDAEFDVPAKPEVTWDALLNEAAGLLEEEVTE